MIELNLENNLFIKFDTDDGNYLRHLRDNFTFWVENRFFMSQFKNSPWMGQISLFKYNKLPFGLFFDWLSFHKQNYKDLEFKVDKNLKNKFIGDEFDIKFDLNLYPYPYQKEAIETSLKYKNSIIRGCTSCGKSLIIAYIIKTLFENKKGKSIIIVPTISLIEQFFNDLTDYGFDKNLIGKVYAKEKDINKTFVISTWQSLKNEINWVSKFPNLIIDECLVANTIIKTNKGDKEIKDLKKFDKVLTFNEKTNNLEFNFVRKVFKNISKEKMLELELEDGTILKITKNHKIFTTNRGWVEAGNLTLEDDIYFYK